MAALEFVVMGTPVSAQSTAPPKRHWQQRVAEAAKKAQTNGAPSESEALVLRIAYFYVDAPAADLDNIVKPLQDALKDIAFVDDIQVVDLVASMRRKGVSDGVPMTASLAHAFSQGSDFVHVTVDRSAVIEVFR